MEGSLKRRGEGLFLFLSQLLGPLFVNTYEAILKTATDTWKTMISTLSRRVKVNKAPFTKRNLVLL